MMHEGEKLVAVHAVSKRLECSLSTVYRLIDKGKLRATVRGVERGYMVYESSIDEHLKRNQNSQ